MGPYLVLLYVNDIVDNISSNMRLFADDTTLFTVIENADSIKTLNEDIYKICKWSNQWCIILNQLKTSSMTFTRKHDNSNLPDVVMNHSVLVDDTSVLHYSLMVHGMSMYAEYMKKLQPGSIYLECSNMTLIGNLYCGFISLIFVPP